ncbi:MAG TPA: EAL domain-containing protein [Rhodanobacteraceae bacterium]
MLQHNEALLAARTTDALVEAATALLRDVVPAVGIERTKQAAHAASVPLLPRNAVAIELPGDEALIATPSGEDGRPLLDAAARVIAARAHVLAEKIALAHSVRGLGRSERLQRALYAIAEQASAASGDLTPTFKAFHRIVGTLMYAENFYIALCDRGRDRVRFAYYADTVDAEPPPPDQEVPLGEMVHGPTWHVLQRGTPLRGSMQEIGNQIGVPLHGLGPAPNDWLGVPLFQGANVTGCVAVQSYDGAHDYDEADQALLIFLAQHIQMALARRFARVELEHQVRERTLALSAANGVLRREVVRRQRGERLQATLFHIAGLATTANSLIDFYQAAHGAVSDLLYARNFYIALLSADGSELTFPYRVDEHDMGPSARKLGGGMTEYVLRKGVAVLADQAELERLYQSGAVNQYGADATSWLGVPMLSDARAIGVIAVQSHSPEHHYTVQDQDLLTFLAYHIADAITRIRAKESLRETLAHLEAQVAARTHELAVANEDLRAQITERERAEARLQYEALHDALTALPNRALFMQQLSHALTRYRAGANDGFAVLFMDLDRFKIINDSEGHLVGDNLLVQASARIRACLKPSDLVARLGGDEFAALLDGVQDATSAGRIATRIIDTLNAPFQLDARELFTSTSIGVTVAAPHYQAPEELLRDADSAMYRAKNNGRHRYVVFDENLRQDAVAQLQMEHDLRGALARGELVPYYQPIVDIETGEVAGYEALMRWHHPQRGVLLPDTFLKVAEDTDIGETGDWQIFTQVCRDMHALLADRNQYVAINLSARHFQNPKFEQQLFRLLDEYRVPATCICAEITEGTLLSDDVAVKHTLQALRGAGIRISLDDFGTGYSSLSYLTQFPIQVLKIDRSFITHLAADSGGSNDAVIRAVLAMAATLSLRVIAEGVETPQQLERLRQLGCRYAQGFLYSKAQPLDAWTRPVAAARPAVAIA